MPLNVTYSNCSTTLTSLAIDANLIPIPGDTAIGRTFVRKGDRFVVASKDEHSSSMPKKEMIRLRNESTLRLYAFPSGSAAG
jgi:hypothetical protein